MGPCKHTDHGDICIPNKEICSKSKRSAATTCPNGQYLRDGNCEVVVPQMPRVGKSAVHQPGQIIGSRPCRSECTCEDNENWDNEGLSWCSFGSRVIGVGVTTHTLRSLRVAPGLAF